MIKLDDNVDFARINKTNQNTEREKPTKSADQLIDKEKK